MSRALGLRPVVYPHDSPSTSILLSILLAGHSLGAGVAALMTLMLRDRQQQGRAAITAISPSTAGHSLGAGVAALMTLMLRDRQRHGGDGSSNTIGTAASPSCTAAANAGVDGGSGAGGNGVRLKSFSAVSSLSHHSVFPLLPAACRVHCICIAPPPMLSEGLAEGCSDCVLSLVHGMDFVSRCVWKGIEAGCTCGGTESPDVLPAVQTAQLTVNIVTPRPISLHPHCYAPSPLFPIPTGPATNFCVTAHRTTDL